MTNPINQTRFERGTVALAAIDGEAGEKVVRSLADIAPDFAQYLIEFPFGDIYSRPQLDLRAREIATIAALTAMGNATPQLKVHLEAGLNVGLSRAEIVEVLMQMAVYTGFPAALNVFLPPKMSLQLGTTRTESNVWARSNPICCHKGLQTQPLCHRVQSAGPH